MYQKKRYCFRVQKNNRTNVREIRNTIVSNSQTFSGCTAVIGRLDAKTEISSIMLSTRLYDIISHQKGLFLSLALVTEAQYAKPRRNYGNPLITKNLMQTIKIALTPCHALFIRRLCLLVEQTQARFPWSINYTECKIFPCTVYKQ